MASPKASREEQVQGLFTKLAPQIKGQQHKKAVRTLDSSKPASNHSLQQDFNMQGQEFQNSLVRLLL